MPQAETREHSFVTEGLVPPSVVLTEQTVNEMLEPPFNRPVEFAALTERHPDLDHVSFVMASFRASMSSKMISPTHYLDGLYAFLNARAGQLPTDHEENLGEVARVYVEDLAKVSEKENLGEAQKFASQVNSSFAADSDPSNIPVFNSEEFPSVTAAVRWRSKLVLKEFGIHQKALLVGLKNRGISSIKPSGEQMPKTSFIWGVVDGAMMIKRGENTVDDKTQQTINNLVQFMTMPYRRPPESVTPVQQPERDLN